MILLVHWHPRMKWTVPQYGRTEGTVRVTENNTVNVSHIYGRWKCRSPRNYCKDIVSPHSCFTVLLLKFTLLHDQFHGLSPWRHAFTAALKSGGAAGATHVQISWISAWIPSEVTRTFFFDLPIWDSNSSPFSCRSSSSQREPTVVGSNISVVEITNWFRLVSYGPGPANHAIGRNSWRIRTPSGHCAGRDGLILTRSLNSAYQRTIANLFGNTLRPRDKTTLGSPHWKSRVSFSRTIWPRLRFSTDNLSRC